MGVEIERKFLVDTSLWVPPETGEFIAQGYLNAKDATVVRVRTMGENAYLTIKGATKGIARMEFEYPIPFADALELLKLTDKQLTKTRYKQVYAGKLWEIDVFAGANTGLVLAEIELSSCDELFECPKWVTKEVTADYRYANNNLVYAPYTTWK